MFVHRSGVGHTHRMLALAAAGSTELTAPQSRGGSCLPPPPGTETRPWPPSLGWGTPLLGGAGLGAFQDVPVSKGLSATHVPPPTEGLQSLSPACFSFLN